MTSSEAIDLMRQAVVLLLVVGAPVLLTGLLIGALVSTLQALTQIQEYTLSFVPKIIAMLVVLMLAGPWMISRLVEFSRDMFGNLP